MSESLCRRIKLGPSPAARDSFAAQVSWWRETPPNNPGKVLNLGEGFLLPAQLCFHSPLTARRLFPLSVLWEQQDLSQITEPPAWIFLHNVIVLNVILKELRHLSKSLGACNETFQLAAVLFYFFLLFWRRLSQFWACCLVPKSSLGLGWILQDCGVTYSAE